MVRYTIYHPDGTAVYTGVCRYTGAYLKVPYIEFDEIASPTAIAWQVGDYVDYGRTGLRYVLSYIPQPERRARDNSSGESFVYKNVQLHDATKDLERVPFWDYVLNDNEIFYSSRPETTTYENVYGIAARIQQCLNKALSDGIIANTWSVHVLGDSSYPLDTTDTEQAEMYSLLSEERDFSISDGSLLECLNAIYDTWSLVGWLHLVDGNTHTLLIGKPLSSVNGVTRQFQYGKGLGLTLVSKSYTNLADMATRLYVFGSSKNMIAGYYRTDSSILNYESNDIERLMIPKRYWGMTGGLYDPHKAYIDATAGIVDALADGTYPIEKYGIIVKRVDFDGGSNGEIYPSISGITAGMERAAYDALTDTTGYYRASSSIYPDDERLDELKTDGTGYDDNGIVSSVMDEGSVSFSGRLVPNTQYAFHVHIPLFTTSALDKRGKVLLTSSIKVTLYSPSITWGRKNLYAVLTSGDEEYSAKVALNFLEDESLITGQYVYEIPSMSYNGTAGEVTLTIDGNLVSGQEVTDSNIVLLSAEGDYTVKVSDDFASTPFTVTLKQIGFDITKQAGTTNALGTLVMKDGACGGRSFPILSCQYNSATDDWTLTCSRRNDTSLGTYFPNNNFPVLEGDHFVLSDIIMPDLYVEEASQKLYERGLALLKELCVPKTLYTPEIDAKIVLQTAYDSSGVCQLKEGKYFKIHDASQYIVETSTLTDYLVIDTLEIREGESNIPTYKVTLRERKTVKYSAGSSSSGSDSSSNNESTQSSTSTVLALPDLTDVSLSGLADKDVLRYNAQTGQWENAELTDNFFELVNIGTEALPVYAVRLKPLLVDGTVVTGMYSEGFVSAGGVSDSTGGGGGGGAVTIINNGDNTYTIDNGTSVTASNLATAAYVAAAIASVAPAAHTHAISDITGLQDALDAKADEDVVGAALASLQAQIDSVSSRDTFDEIYATVISADMLSAETIYAGNMLGQWEGHEVSYFATASALSALDTRVTALEDLFEIVDGNVHVKNNRGLYSDSFISAGGLSDSGGSGGGGGTAVSWGSVVASDTGTSYGLTVGSVTHNLYTVAGVDAAISSALSSYYTQSQISSLLSGYAPLGQDSKIPSAYLPSYVDDVLEYSSVSGFPSTGETGKIYIATDTNKTYRWTGSGYAEISQSLALGETSATAYRGDRGKIAYDHSQTTGNPHGTTFAQINGSLTASQIPNLDWSKITSGKPTTLAEYGITDAYTKTEIDANVVHKAGEEQISGLKIFNGDLMSANYIIGSTSTSYSYLSANNSMRYSEFELCRSDDDAPYLAFGDSIGWGNDIVAGVFINDIFQGGTVVKTPNFRVTDSIGFTGEVADSQNNYLKGLEYDSTHHAWHLRGNFYADGFISAGGLSDSSSTGAVSWGVATGQYTPLSIGNDTRNLSLSGHTHTVSDITDYTSATNALITSALAAYTPSSAIQPLTFGSKSYNGSTAQEITAADLGALTGITSAMVTTALGYTPYDGTTNPNGYISSYTNNYLSAVSASGTTITFSRQGLSALTLTLAASNIPTLTSSKISDFATAANSAITKATIDALGVDAGTLDGHDSTYFGVDDNVVHKTGAETIAGVKTFSDSIAVKNFFNGITATNESFVASTSPPITRYSASPENFVLWHDRLGFAGDNIVANEVTTDGETWEAASDTSTLKGLFTFHSTSISILTSAQKGRRITLRETNYSNSQMRWMVFYLAYIGTTATASITIESSADNSTWTTRSTSASFNTWSNIVYCYGNFGAAQYLRITITKTSTSGGVNMSQIRGLTARWGDQGQGSVNSYPYNWDASKNIYPWSNNKQTLGTSSYRWSYVYGVTGNFTTGVFTTAQATTYKFTAEDTDTGNTFTKGLVYDATNHAWHLRGNFYADGFVSAGGLTDGSDDGSVSWGTATAQYTPLTIGDDTRNLSLSGHTHTTSEITDYSTATDALIQAALAAYTPSSAIQDLTFGAKTYNGSTAQTILASDLDALTVTDAETYFASLQAQIDSLGSRNAYDELRATVFSADILSANTAYLGNTTISGTITTSYTTMVTNLNADKVDGYNANGLFTALTNSGNNISISIGGTTKTLAVGYAASAAKTSGTLTIADADGNVGTFDGSASPTLTIDHVSKADTLNTARTINGTSFDGSANITTARWGQAQNFYIDDSNSDHRGASTSVNGSADVVLKLPSTITATLDGNASTATTLATARTINGTSFDGSANITTARWGASQNFYIDDSTSSNRGVSTSVNGSADVVLKLPSTIAADLTGNASTATTLVTAAGDAYHPVYIDSTGAHQITSLNLVNANSLTNGGIAAKCAWVGNNIVINDSSTSGYLGTILFDDTEDSAAELTFDFANYAFRFSQSVYSTGFVSAGGLSTTSDARLKDNITAIGDYEAVSVLRALQPVSWVWNDKSSNKGEGQGFIAQEVAPLIPNSTLKIGEYYSLKYDSILPYLAKGWQVHETRIDRLEGEVKALREEVKTLKNQHYN